MGHVTEPERHLTQAQREYDSHPELRELLTRAAESSTIRRSRQRGVDRAT